MNNLIGFRLLNSEIGNNRKNKKWLAEKLEFSSP